MVPRSESHLNLQKGIIPAPGGKHGEQMERQSPAPMAVLDLAPCPDPGMFG